jgi:arabinose-5-phosphate isomerase
VSLLLRISEKIGDDVLLERGREVIRIEAEALKRLDTSLDGSFVAACRMILAAGRRIVVTGMGKSGHIGRKLAATLSATGTPAMFIHPAEAGHGDLGMLMEGDVLLVLSNSGNTTELRAVLDYARKMDIKIIGVASHRASLVMDFADVAICLPTIREACAANIAPTTSTTLQLALGDAMALAVMDARGISKNRLRALHPAGMIGMRLTPIAELMHTADEVPLVVADTGMPDVISVITRCRFGLAGVVDERGALIGVITDGDLRRHFDQLNSALAVDVMTRSPKSIASDMLASDALMYLNDAKITAAFVVNRLDTANAARPVGIVHIHDLLQYGLN